MMNTAEQNHSASNTGNKKAGPDPGKVIWDDQWVPNADAKHWKFLDDPNLSRSADFGHLPNPHEVIDLWKKDEAFASESPQRQKEIINNLYQSYSEFMNKDRGKAFNEAFETQDVWLAPPSAGDLAALDADNKAAPSDLTEEEFDALWRERHDPNSPSIRLQTAMDGAGRSVVSAPGRAVGAIRGFVDRIRPEQREWYNPAPEALESRQAAQESRRSPRETPGPGSSPLQMRNDTQLTPAGRVAVDTGRSVVDYGRRLVGGLGDYFDRAKDQLPVRVQEAQRTVAILQAKVDAGQQLSEHEAQIGDREMAILARFDQGSDVIRTGVDKNTGKPVVQIADGRIGYAQ